MLLGTISESDVNRTIADGLPVTDLTGQTSLYDLPSLAAQSLGAIGNDTGPMHILSVTNCPLLALFDKRQSNVLKHGPQGARSHTIESEDLSTLDAHTVYQKWMEIYNKA